MLAEVFIDLCYCGIFILGELKIGMAKVIVKHKLRRLEISGTSLKTCASNGVDDSIFHKIIEGTFLINKARFNFIHLFTIFYNGIIIQYSFNFQITNNLNSNSSI